MPVILLTSKNCPQGMESNVYDLLVSYLNLGVGVCRTFSDALAYFMNIRTTETCNYKDLPLPIMIAHVALPSLIFPVMFILIPDATMTDNLIEEENDVDSNSRMNRDLNGRMHSKF